MSGTAIEYDVSRLGLGLGIAAISMFLAIVAASSTILGSLRSSLPVLLISLLYGIMMFASSYVEEEQHFWYWAATAWLTMLWIKR